MTNLATLTPSSHPGAANQGLFAICPAAMTGWALRTADGLITTGILDLAMPEPQADAQCNLSLVQWLSATARQSGPIRAITVVTLPPFMASAMHPAPTATLQAWAVQQGIPCDLVTYAELLSEIPGDPAAGRSMPGRGFSPACHAEALAIVALERLFSTLDGAA